MKLLEKHFDIALETPDGVSNLRELILKLAMQGKLASQNQKDKPADILLKEINEERNKLIKKREIRKQVTLEEIKNISIPYELPKSWKWVKLNDYGTWKSGSTPSRNNNSFYDGKIPWVKSGEVKQGKIKETSELITELALEKCSLSLNPIGAVLIAMYGANIGEVGILEIEATTNQAVCACKTYSGIYNLFLFNLLQSLKSNFISQGAGAAQPNISREKIINTVVPLPPYNEQVRIVQKIDELMHLCDKLEIERDDRKKLQLTIHKSAMNEIFSSKDKNSLSKSSSFISSNFNEIYSVVENVSDLRNTILQFAITGKLIEQNKNDDPAIKLLEKLDIERNKLVKAGEIKKTNLLPPIKNDEIPFQLPKGWEWSRLGTICSKIGSGSTPRGGKEVYQNKGVKFIRSQNVYDEGLIFNNDVYINEDTHLKMSNTKVLPNDILLNITGGSIGRCALVPKDFDEANVSQHVTIIRLLKGIEHKFIHQFILSPYFQDKIMQVQTGGNREGLAKKNMELMLVPLPPLNEQKQIVSKVIQLNELVNSLCQYINEATDKKTEILRAVLAKL